MFDDILNDGIELPDSFSIPNSDLVEKILLKDVDSISELIESFKECVTDLQDFQQEGYDIMIVDDGMFFEK